MDELKDTHVTEKLTKEEFALINKFGLKVNLGFELYKERPNNLYISDGEGGKYQFDLDTILTLATLSDNATLIHTDV